MIRSSRVLPPLIAVGLLLGGCAPVGVVQAGPTPAATTPPAGTASATAAPTTASPSPTPSPSPSPESLMPGTNHNLAAAKYAHPAADVEAWSKDATTAPGKLVFLTFDDGPNHAITPRILDDLKAAGVHATFFLVGQNISDAPDMLERQIAEGHAIALHSWSHNYKRLYPGRKANAERVAEEFDKTIAAVREVLGADFNTTAWRYPGGHMSWKNMAAADAALAKRGAAWVDWNAMTGDAEPKSRRPGTVAEMISMATSPIANEVPVVVMLAHDTNDKELTAKSMPAIIEAYREAGYEFGVIS